MTVNTLSKELDAGWADKLWWCLPKISYWDFAGQLEYSAAHDFFMSSKQAVFVIIFSVMEDRASQCQQVSYWLKTVLSRSPKHVRILIVGTKVDFIDADKFQQTLDGIRLDMSSVVRCCCDSSIASVTKILFVTSMGNHPQYNALRGDFKKSLYSCCTQIFAGRDKLLRFPEEYQQMLADVEKLKELGQGSGRPVLPIVRLKDIIDKGAFPQLFNSHSNQQKLQALRVLHDVGALILYEVEEAGERLHSICWEPQIVADIIAAFADPQSEVLSESHDSARLGRACFLLPDLLAFLENNLPNYRDDRSVADAMAEFRQQQSNHAADEDPSLFGSKSRAFAAFFERMLPNLAKLFKFLQALGIFMSVPTAASNPDEAPSLALDDDCVFMVPSALKGRPSFWREIADGNDTWVRGLRFSSTAGLVTVACFVRVMSAMCVVPRQMWGCAFVLPIDDDTTLFVRLAESRASVDTVILSRSSRSLISEHVSERCREIAQLLGCSHASPLLLCPYCCATDMYVRSGAAHSFYENQAQAADTPHFSRTAPPPSSQQVSSALLPNRHGLVSAPQAKSSHLSPAYPPAAPVPLDAHAPAKMQSASIGSTVHRCSRYHDLRMRQLMCGILVSSLGSVTTMPPLYPSTSKDNNGLDWMIVTEMGLLEVSRDDGGVHFEVLPNSFFCLTLQLVEGDELSAASAAAFNTALADRSSNDPDICTVEIMRKGAKASETRQVQLRFRVGDTLPQSLSNPIQVHVIDMILACSCSVVICEANAAAGIVTTTSRHGLEAGERVLLSVRFDSDASVVEGILCLVSLVPSDNQLSLSRAVAASDPGFSKPLPLHAGVTLIPLRTSFTPMDNVLVVYKRTLPTDRRPKFAVFPGATRSLKIARMSPKDCINSAACAVQWREVEDNWAIMLGSEFQNYELSRVTLFHNSERDQLFLNEVQRLKDAAALRPPPNFGVGKDRVDHQKQIMGHFKDFSQKFSLLPPGECTDVNAIVAWWGNMPSVYHTVAQNGFWSLPMHLKLDPGYFGGDGFYLSRFPRYNDYYLSGCSLAPQNIGDGNILMYALTALSLPPLHFDCRQSGVTPPLEGRILLLKIPSMAPATGTRLACVGSLVHLGLPAVALNFMTVTT